MPASLITPELKKDLSDFLQANRKADLLQAYIFFVERRFQLAPVIFPGGKIIFESADKAIELLEKEGKLCHEAQIHINVGRESVNDQTKRIYICPFCGKVYGDNTHLTPQDAIYEHVAKCPKNNERRGGLRSKRFYISEDKEMIKNYIQERKEPITKTVYSSVVTGKLYNSKSSIIRDFKENHLKPITATEALGQNRFDIEDHFLADLQKQLEEDKISAFVEEISEHEEFAPYVQRWVESEE